MPGAAVLDGGGLGGLGGEQTERTALLQGDEASALSAPPPTPLVGGARSAKGGAEAVVRAGLAGSVFNVANTIIGAGILALPFSFRHSGMVLGWVLLTFVAILMSYSVRILVRAAIETNRKSYEDLAYYAFGKRGHVALTLSMTLLCFGLLLAYAVLVGELLPEVVALAFGEDSVLADRITVLAVTVFGIMFPLSMQRELNALRFTSTLALFAIIYLVVVVVVRSQHLSVEGSIDEARLTTDIFLTVPIISLAFCCHPVLFNVKRELLNPTEDRMSIVFNAAISVCFVMYGLVATFGYATFYEEVQGNILLNYDANDPYIVAGRLVVSLILMCSYPLLALPCRTSLDDLLFHDKPMTWLRHTVLTVVIVTLSFALAVVVPSVEIVFDLTGSSATSAICYIFPAAIALRVSRVSIWDRTNWGTLVLLGMGLVTAFVGTSVSIYNIVAGEDDGFEDH